MARAELAAIAAEIRGADSFLVTTHAHPDGDAVGSMLAMDHLLRATGKRDIVCAVDGEVPRVYQWLPGAGRIVGPPEVAGRCFDRVIVLDVSVSERLGAMADALAKGKRVLVLDHHLGDASFGDAAFVDPSYAAVGEILVELHREMRCPPGAEAALCAYVALVTDTGGFRFSNTSPRSHRIAAELLEAGVDAAEVSQRVFDTISRAKFHLLERVLERALFTCDGRLVHTQLNRQDLAETDALSEDSDGLINVCRNVQGVEVALLFRELDTGNTKVSCRAEPPINAAAALAKFDGGGHAAAAGATIPMPVDETRRAVVAHMTALLGGRDERHPAGGQIAGHDEPRRGGQGPARGGHSPRGTHGHP